MRLVLPGEHACGDRDAVPGVGRRDRPDQLGELFVVEVFACGVERFAGSVRVGELRDRVGELERGALALAEERRLMPGGDGEERLLGLAA